MITSLILTVGVTTAWLAACTVSIIRDCRAFAAARQERQQREAALQAARAARWAGWNESV